MPNIIEQQDLLKNLPDARLATLLQNPVADIPPFLVAAEAQRRQSIRQQFAGSESKESVVDSLAKQISKVPQNIQSPMQTPPMIPPTPQMQGVAALQQQQAVQGAVQQAQQQPQQMRHGGMVQRYYDGGTVKPWWQIPDISGVFSGAGEYIGSKVSELADWATKPYSERKAEEDSSEPDIVDKASIPPLPPGAASGMSFTPALPKEETETIEPLTGEPPPPPEPGETKDEYRARLEALFASQEPSNWEKAQKWFAMAEQFLDPSKTTMQSIAGAGQAFAQSAAEQARAKRELELAGKKAMLEYDISERDRLAAQKTAKREEQIGAYKFYAEQAKDQIKAFANMMDDVARKKAEYIKNTYTDMDGTVNVDPNDPTIANFDEQIRIYSEAIRGYTAQQQNALGGFGKVTGTDPSVLIFTGNSLSRFGK